MTIVAWIIRILTGLLGLLMLVNAVNFWVDPMGAGASLGVGPLEALGVSTIRADFGAFFALGGGFAVIAAVQNRRACWSFRSCCSVWLCWGGSPRRRPMAWRPVSRSRWPQKR